MSSHFSANQYEGAFSPQRLQNYEIPAKFKESPSSRRGKTAIICNDRGHLNSSVPHSSTSPWGTFVGTWQRERKPIELKTKTKLLAQSAIPVLSLGSKPVGGKASSCSDHSAADEKMNEVEAGVQTPTPNQSDQHPPLSPDGEHKESKRENTKLDTTGSEKSSAQGSRAQSPLVSGRSPGMPPPSGSRASTASIRSVSILSNRPQSTEQ